MVGEKSAMTRVSGYQICHQILKMQAKIASKREEN